MTRRQTRHAIKVCIGYTDVERLKSTHEDASEENRALVEIFQGVGWEPGEILDDMKDINNFYGERMGLVKLEFWFHGRVALVGDAAHCPSFNTGMGTTRGIVGSYVLAGESGRHYGRSTNTHADDADNGKDDLTAALQAYATKFRPFTSQVQKGVG